MLNEMRLLAANPATDGRALKLLKDLQDSPLKLLHFGNGAWSQMALKELGLPMGWCMGRREIMAAQVAFALGHMAARTGANIDVFAAPDGMEAPVAPKSVALPVEPPAPVTSAPELTPVEIAPVSDTVAPVVALSELGWHALRNKATELGIENIKTMTRAEIEAAITAKLG